MSLSLDQIFELASNLEEERLSLFVSLVAHNEFNPKQTEIIYKLIEKGSNPTELVSKEFLALKDEHLDFIIELVESNHHLENILNLISYGDRVISKILDYYTFGCDLVPLLDIENANWYVEFLLKCLYANINVLKLFDKGFHYNQIYDLSVCMCLGLDINDLTFVSDVTKQDILDYFIGNLFSNRIFVVEGFTLENPSKLEHCVVKAPNPRMAKLISCLYSEFDVFTLGIREVNLDEFGIIYDTVN